MAGELAAGVVFVDGHFGAGDAGILGVDIDARGGPRMLGHLAEITDLDGCHRRGDCGTSNREAARPSFPVLARAVVALAASGAARRLIAGDGEASVRPCQEREARRRDRGRTGSCPKKRQENLGRKLHGGGTNDARELRRLSVGLNPGLALAGRVRKRPAERCRLMVAIKK